MGRLDQPIQFIAAPGAQAPDQEESFQNADVLLGGAQVESGLPVPHIANVTISVNRGRTDLKTTSLKRIAYFLTSRPGPILNNLEYCYS